jgi:N utilization substance protein B
LLAELPVAPEEYASQLVLGVERRAEEVNRLLGCHATGWAVERMPMVDRCVLRMAAYELLDELEDSGRYVNGVLSAVATEVRPKEQESADPSFPGSLE